MANYKVGDVEFKMTMKNRDNITNGNSVFKLCDSYGEKVATNATRMSGYSYGIHTVFGKHRVHSRVYCTGKACNNDTYDNNTLLKAM